MARHLCSLFIPDEVEGMGGMLCNNQGLCRLKSSAFLKGNLSTPWVLAYVSSV